ncbi:hypothetical protein ACIPYS_19890 [Kitasatospora sp. NPDC089913]|uniref:hypothetical protein n=1 Tax=Kitasatospora sp. NPDC089913 TaxID=3364080 RepID=UPI00382D5630
MEQQPTEVHPAVQAFATQLRNLRHAAGIAGGFSETVRATGLGVSTVKAVVAHRSPRLPSRNTMQLLAGHWGGDPERWLQRLNRAQRDSRTPIVQGQDSLPAGPARSLPAGETRNLSIPTQLDHVRTEVTELQIVSKLARSSHRELMRTLRLLLARMEAESPAILAAFTRPTIPVDRIQQVWSDKLPLQEDITPLFGDWMNIILTMENFLRFVLEKDPVEVDEAKAFARLTADQVQQFRRIEAEVVVKSRHMR